MTVLRNYVQTISCHLLSVLIEGEITDLDGNNKVPNPSPPLPIHTHKVTVHLLKFGPPRQ